MKHVRTWMIRAHSQLLATRDRGASALEWALIAAVVVVAASLIGGAVYNAVADKAADVEQCTDVAVGGTC